MLSGEVNHANDQDKQLEYQHLLQDPVFGDLYLHLHIPMKFFCRPPLQLGEVQYIFAQPIL